MASTGLTFRSDRRLDILRLMRHGCLRWPANEEPVNDGLFAPMTEEQAIDFLGRIQKLNHSAPRFAPIWN